MPFVTGYAIVGALGCAAIGLWVSNMEPGDVSLWARKINVVVAGAVPEVAQHDNAAPVPAPSIPPPDPPLQASAQATTATHVVPAQAAPPKTDDAENEMPPAPPAESDVEPPLFPSPPIATQEPPAATVANDLDWGVTTNRKTSVYLLSGKFQGGLPPGIIVEVVDRRFSQAQGELIVFRFLRGDVWAGPYLTRAESVDLAEGPLSEANPQERALRLERAQRLGELYDFLERKWEQDERTHPQIGRYRDAHAAFKRHSDRAEEMRARLETVQGHERSRLLNDLREMKNDEVRLRNQYNAAKREFETWQRQATARPPSTEEVAIRNRIAEVGNKLKHYAQP